MSVAFSFKILLLRKKFLNKSFWTFWRPFFSWTRMLINMSAHVHNTRKKTSQISHYQHKLIVKGTERRMLFKFMGFKMQFNYFFQNCKLKYLVLFVSLLFSLLYHLMNPLRILFLHKFLSSHLNETCELVTCYPNVRDLSFFTCALKLSQL